MLCHIDADAFFASVLQRKYPRLRGKPLLALGMGDGCVIAASYEAKAKGVRTGMRLYDARKLCKRAIEMPSDFKETAVASKQIASIVGEQCPVTEQMSVDEWLLDLQSIQGGLPGNLRQWAERMQKSVLHRTGISVSVGIARSRLLAKMASEYRKPSGVTIITEKNLEGFLKDRPAAAIPGIGKCRSVHVKAHRWKTAWDVALAAPEHILQVFGKPGREMQRELLGTQVHRVREGTNPPKSISRCRSFRVTGSREAIFSSLMSHLSYTVLNMRRQNGTCREIGVWLRDSTYQRHRYNVKLPRPMDTEEHILPFVHHCFKHLYRQTPLCTQAGLSLSQLQPKGQPQCSLFEDTQSLAISEQIQKKLDELHERFGRTSITRASALPMRDAEKSYVYTKIET